MLSVHPCAHFRVIRVTCINMPSETKASLIEKMLSYGEETPRSWTVLQIKARLSELKAERGGPPKPELKVKMIDLNKAAKKKADLLEFASKLGLNVSNNMTIAQIYALAEHKITLEVVPTGTDKMNFGQYRDLTYEEVMIQHPSYVMWAQKMVAEGDVCWRLARWIQWVNLEAQKPKSHQPTTRSKMSTTPQRGYTTARGSHSKDLPGDSSDTSFSLVEQDQQHEIEALKLELARVKQEKLELESTVGPTKLRREM